MAELSQELARRLIDSSAWRVYCEDLCTLYHRVSARLDTTERDHRYVQGQKMGLKHAIEYPYRQAQEASPLETDQPDRARPPALPHADERAQDEALPLRTRRAAYMA